MQRIILILFLVLCLQGETAENTLVDFKKIRQVIKNDMLTDNVKSKEQKVESKKSLIEKKNKAKYDIPGEPDFWSFLSEYWLIKNAALLKWDFEKPDYGVDDAFVGFLEKMGFYEKKFKILFLNTPDVTHVALPTDSNEYIFLLSVPFVRVLDLSKLEICFILFEDFLRARMNYFKDFVRTKELSGFLGGNFAEKNLDMNVIKKVLSRYDEIVFDKGFSFQQQFEVTKQFDKILKSDLKIWNGYLTLLKKIDNLVKSNILYEKYAKIYPSPELQISWLIPKKKVLD